ncbi:UNVERIFIED_CONTAM: Bifunctional bis(5'-adenosyl)-triphosphatase/adenylylsulfatase FHIT [Sesamum angustifolium]|uniref:Bifunctional bis(5'-adenosyl)-triphosphatase/adenylylsulfatase FHIT n=1 Tax=Sesamum angustifolium TaxID=2727405 RepID=A0AAW2QPJ3_9LAMI
MPRWSLRVIPSAHTKSAPRKCSTLPSCRMLWSIYALLFLEQTLSRVVDYLLLYCSESYVKMAKQQKLKETSLFEKLFCTSTRPRFVSSDIVLIVGCVCSLLQKIGHQLESYHNASSLTFTIQDGPKAGQTVPHVHIHILPRKSGDFENNDEIYEAIDSKEKELKQKLDLDKERKDRSMEEMAEEAAEYRKLFS